ncbi:MAG: LysM peptidoglycan-binding domain-containing protein [Candidatus Wildermuthbacteria bacterium]|nr:LysM peptidoglycan-binding domain-containing protein [Candidatus Wildermuthbacteria bacterium]
MKTKIGFSFLYSTIFFLSLLSWQEGRDFDPALAAQDLDTQWSVALSQVNATAFSGNENLNGVFIDQTGLQAASVSYLVGAKTLAVEAATGGSAAIEPEVAKYTVESGDSISSIAKKFGISSETILWANDLSAGTALTVGQELLILPVSGALHLVNQNDTLSGIAALYGVDGEAIADFNQLSSPDEIYAGDLLIVPGGKRPRLAPARNSIPLAQSYFIAPIPAPYRRTQGLHPYNAVDLSNGECKEPVYAAAGGTVQKTGYDRVAGNYVRLLHPNGVVTFYGHLSRILVGSGEQVLQGQTIASTGYTGYTIPAGPAGCHLHFEVRGAQNPFAR